MIKFLTLGRFDAISLKMSMYYCFKQHCAPTTGSVPPASTSVTVLGLVHVINTMVPVAQAVTRTGLDLPVNIVRAVRCNENFMLWLSEIERLIL